MNKIRIERKAQFVKNTHNQLAARSLSKSGSGFSLIELMVALSVFLIISAGAMTLVQQHVPMATTVQNQVAMNLGLSNAIAQMQNDVINAGSGYYNLLNNTDSAIGITVINCGNVSTGCNGNSGNDTLNVMAVTPNTVGMVTDQNGATSGAPATSCSDTSTIATASTAKVYLFPQMNPPSSAPTAAAATALAAQYPTGSYILLLNATSGGNQFTIAELNAAAFVSPTNSTIVELPINATEVGGVSETFGISSGVWSSDPFYVTKDTSDIPGTSTPRLTDTFCYGSATVMKLGTMITYSVDSNQNLTRNGVAVAPNILSFKVGAMAINTGSDTDESAYVFNAPNNTPASGCNPTTALDCGFNNDWPLIRSVMVSVVARTAANVTNQFRNTYDGGDYQVQAVTTILNPRNLSLRDNVNTENN